MGNFIVIGIVFVLVMLALFVLCSQKKKNTSCCLCPMAGNCMKRGSCEKGSLARQERDVFEEQIVKKEVVEREYKEIEK